MIARRLAAWLLVAAAAVAVAACSTADFAYRNAGFLYDHADTWILWSVDDYLDLTPAQKDFARERLGRALDWHRRNVLPEYARFLSQIERQVDAGLGEDALREDRDRLRDYYRQLADHLLPDVADLFAQLDPAQVEDLAHRLDKADVKILHEAKRSREKAIARTLDHLQAWTGPLTSTQRDLVASRMRAQPDLTVQRVAEWRVRQSQLIALMRERPPREAVVQALHGLLFDTGAWRDPAYARALDARDEAMIEMLADLARTLTPEQVAQVRARIHGLQADIARQKPGSEQCCQDAEPKKSPPRTNARGGSTS